LSGSALRLTVSIGVSANTGNYADSDALIKSVDQALYRAKQLGRNRVVSSDELFS
jgi:diguanylate cyclase (GGDEF)-like protein